MKIHYTYIEDSIYLHGTFMLPTSNIHCAYIVRSLCIHCTFIVHTLYRHCTYIIPTLYLYCTYIVSTYLQEAWVWIFILVSFCCSRPEITPEPKLLSSTNKETTARHLTDFNRPGLAFKWPCRVKTIISLRPCPPCPHIGTISLMRYFNLEIFLSSLCHFEEKRFFIPKCCSVLSYNIGTFYQ